MRATRPLPLPRPPTVSLRAPNPRPWERAGVRAVSNPSSPSHPNHQGLACSNLLVFAGVDLLHQSLVATKIVTAVVVLFVNYSLRVMLLYRSDSA